MRRISTAQDAAAHGAPFSVAAWGLIFLAGFLSVTIVGTAGVEAASYLTLVTVIALIASVIIPNAARKQPGISGRTLAIALGMFLLGSLARYLIIQTIYGGASDSRGYFGAGLTLSAQFRVQDFRGLIPPFTDTNAINYFSGFLYMLLPPSQLAGFVVSAGMSFIGSFHFYKAFVLAYPPTRARTAHVQALSYIVFLPVFAVAVILLINQARSQIGSLEGSDVSIAEAYQTQQEANLTGGSNFTPPNPFSPVGLPLALITANFRPFPFEAGGFFPMLQSLEGVFLLSLLGFKRRAAWAAVKTWRHNAMTIMVAAAILIISVELTALANFGLLARQRTQVLPFLVMVPCMAKVAKRRKTEPAADRSAPFPAWASASRS
ncbi:MAG: hypothetical protein LC722_01415 [Actinobacteria bacterium]|nr:hypothetical protein [Actinomycetota bacterium]